MKARMMLEVVSNIWEKDNVKEGEISILISFWRCILSFDIKDGNNDIDVKNETNPAVNVDIKDINNVISNNFPILFDKFDIPIVTKVKIINGIKNCKKEPNISENVMTDLQIHNGANFPNKTDAKIDKINFKII